MSSPRDRIYEGYTCGSSPCLRNVHCRQKRAQQECRGRCGSEFKSLYTEGCSPGSNDRNISMEPASFPKHTSCNSTSLSNGNKLEISPPWGQSSMKITNFSPPAKMANEPRASNERCGTMYPTSGLSPQAKTSSVHTMRCSRKVQPAHCRGRLLMSGRCGSLNGAKRAGICKAVSKQVKNRVLNTAFLVDRCKDGISRAPTRQWMVPCRVRSPSPFYPVTPPIHSNAGPAQNTATAIKQQACAFMPPKSSNIGVATSAPSSNGTASWECGTPDEPANLRHYRPFTPVRPGDNRQQNVGYYYSTLSAPNLGCPLDTFIGRQGAVEVRANNKCSVPDAAFIPQSQSGVVKGETSLGDPPSYKQAGEESLQQSETNVSDWVNRGEKEETSDSKKEDKGDLVSQDQTPSDTVKDRIEVLAEGSVTKEAVDEEKGDLRNDETDHMTKGVERPITGGSPHDEQTDRHVVQALPNIPTGEKRPKVTPNFEKDDSRYFFDSMSSTASVSLNESSSPKLITMVPQATMSYDAAQSAVEKSGNTFSQASSISQNQTVADLTIANTAEIQVNQTSSSAGATQNGESVSTHSMSQRFCFDYSYDPFTVQPHHFKEEPVLPSNGMHSGDTGNGNTIDIINMAYRRVEPPEVSQVEYSVGTAPGAETMSESNQMSPSIPEEIQQEKSQPPLPVDATAELLPTSAGNNNAADLSAAHFSYESSVTFPWGVSESTHYHQAVEKGQLEKLLDKNDELTSKPANEEHTETVQSTSNEMVNIKQKILEKINTENEIRNLRTSIQEELAIEFRRSQKSQSLVNECRHSSVHQYEVLQQEQQLQDIGSKIELLKQAEFDNYKAENQARNARIFLQDQFREAQENCWQKEWEEIASDEMLSNSISREHGHGQTPTEAARRARVESTNSHGYETLQIGNNNSSGAIEGSLEKHESTDGNFIKGDKCKKIKQTTATKYVVDVGRLSSNYLHHKVEPNEAFEYEFMNSSLRYSDADLGVKASKSGPTSDQFNAKEVSSTHYPVKLGEHDGGSEPDLNQIIQELKLDEARRIDQEVTLRDGRIAIQDHLRYEIQNLEKLRLGESQLKSDYLKNDSLYKNWLDHNRKIEVCNATITELRMKEFKKFAQEKYVREIRQAIQEQIHYHEQLKLEIEWNNTIDEMNEMSDHEEASDEEKAESQNARSSVIFSKKSTLSNTVLEPAVMASSVSISEKNNVDITKVSNSTAQQTNSVRKTEIVNKARAETVTNSTPLQENPSSRKALPNTTHSTDTMKTAKSSALSVKNLEKKQNILSEHVKFADSGQVRVLRSENDAKGKDIEGDTSSMYTSAVDVLGEEKLPSGTSMKEARKMSIKSMKSTASESMQSALSLLSGSGKTRKLNAESAASDTMASSKKDKTKKIKKVKVKEAAQSQQNTDSKGTIQEESSESGRVSTEANHK